MVRTLARLCNHAVVRFWLDARLFVETVAAMLSQYALILAVAPPSTCASPRGSRWPLPFPTRALRTYIEGSSLAPASCFVVFVSSATWDGLEPKSGTSSAFKSFLTIFALPLLKPFDVSSALQLYGAFGQPRTSLSTDQSDRLIA